MVPVAEAVHTPDLFTGFEKYPLSSLCKALVTGSRGWTDESIIRSALLDNHVTSVVHGGCPVRNIAPLGAHPIWASADGLADRIARALKLPVTVYKAEWERLGIKAGIIRNSHMLERENPDIVLAFWDGVSHGTAHMISIARKRGFRVKVYRGQIH